MYSDLQDVAWYQAATLAERIESVRALGHAQQGAEANKDVAGRRLQQWCAQRPFANASTFARRLATEGITEAEFLGLLGEPLESARAHFVDIPPWLRALSHAFVHHSLPNSVPLPTPLGEEPAVGFLNAIEPLLRHGLDRFRKQAQQLIHQRHDAPFSTVNLEVVFLSDLPRQLLAMLGRTLVLELNVARLEGVLDGVTPEDRFQSFVERLRRPEIGLRILREYPVLARQLVIRIDQWVRFVLEFLGRLCADWDVIGHTFSADKAPGVLERLQTGAGDRHRMGRSVVICEFSSGLRLVYKPRSLAADVHFQALVKWFNQRGFLPALRVSQILDRGTHGWVQFIAAEGCDSEAALSRFYERQGACLALLHALAATDFHCENVIAAGEDPMLVDLEAIFHPSLPGSQAERDDEIERLIEGSVLRVGLLPLRIGANAESEGADFTGLGGAAGQMTPHPVPGWARVGTDEMQLVRQRITTSPARNRPSLNASDVNPCDHAEEIAAGFARAYRLLLKFRDELLSSAGPLACFAHDEVRVVLRGTEQYGRLLDETFHPDVLRDALDRDLLLGWLWVAAESRPYLTKAISAELQDLENGDIPLFTTRPSSRDLWTSSGQPICDFFDEPAMAFVRRRLQQLSELDLELQLWFIRASLGTSSEYRHGAQGSTPDSSGPHTAMDRERLLAAARGLGDRLASLAVPSKQGTSWVGLTFEGERRWSISPLMLDLYGGLPGVTLFLAYLGAITGEQRYTVLAQRAGETMLRRLEKNQSSVKSIGAFSGWGGVIYTLSHLGALWREAELLNKAEALAATLRSLIEQDEYLDIIGGAAGCIGGLLSLHDQVLSERTLHAAVQCGECLVARAQQMEHGAGWLVPREPRPLAGFAHGAAGIAWALLKLAAVTGGEHFRTTALAGIEYERSLFSREAENWRDLRAWTRNHLSSNGDGNSFMTAWCAGAPGIGLARVSALEQLDDVTTRREIDAALKTTLTHGFGQNHSLCHGDLGNIEVFLQAGQIFDDSRWHTEASRLGGMIVESIARNQVLCGTPMGVATPGLMTGLAGIGYGLLRLAEPQRIPSVLTLEPPPRNRG
jgi:type 2 lantibiotic biosynthesis protein LanM